MVKRGQRKFFDFFIATCFGLLFFVPQFLFVKAALASEDGVFFSEIMWNGSSISSSDEWIELYNAGTSVVDIGGYSLFDCVKGEAILTIESGQIAPKGYFLISNNDQNHKFTNGESILNVPPDIKNSSLSISNSNFQIKLIGSDKEELDIAGDGNSPFYYSYKKSSIYRKTFDPKSGDKIDSWGVYQQNSQSDSPCTQKENLDDGAVECATPNQSGRPTINYLNLSKTKFKKDSSVIFEIDSEVFDFNDDLDFIIIENDLGQSWHFNPKAKTCDLGKFSKNSKIKIIYVDKTGLFDQRLFDILFYQYSKDVFISEVVPHPVELDFNQDGKSDSNDEFFEIANSSPFRINLDSWSVVDASGKKFFLPNVELEFGEYAVFFKNQSGIALNDSGETLTLLNQEGEKIDEVSIPSSSTKKDLSYSRWANLWHWSQTATAKSENIIKKTNRITDISQENLENPIGTQVSLSAQVVEVERASFGVELPYGRIDIFKKGDESIDAGSKVEIEGTVESSQPLIVSASKIFIYTRKNISDEGAENNQNTAQQDDYIVETNFRKITKVTKRSKNLSGIALGANDNGGSRGLRSTLFMLQLSGVLSFLLLIILYEIYSKQRE